MRRPESADYLSRLRRYARACVESMGRNPLPGGDGSRVLAVALATLVIASVIAPAFAGVAVASSASTGPPEGMVGVPDANIVEDVPIGASVPLSASELRGSVMTSAHADTLELTVTTPDRASDLVGSSTVTVSGGGEVALVISDDTNAAGRKVALPLTAVQDALGYAPEQVHGTHEDGERWSRPTSETGGLLVFEVPHFSSNAVTFESEIRLNGSPATNGASYSYGVNDVDAVSDPTIQFTGSTATSRDDESASGLSDGSTVSLSVGGNLEPTGPANGDPRVVFSGERTTSPFSTSGTATGGDTTTVDIAGTESPESVSMTFDGETSTAARTVSKTAVASGTSTSYTVNGNVAPTSESVTFTGVESTTPNDQSGSVSAGGSASVSTGGNLDPTGPANGAPKLTITAPTRQTGQTAGTDTGVNLFGINSQGYASVSEVAIEDPGGYITEIHIAEVFQNGAGSANVDIYIASESPDGTVDDGTKVKSGWTPSNTEGPRTVSLDSPYKVTTDGTATVQFVTTGGSESTFSQNPDASCGSNMFRNDNYKPGEGESIPSANDQSACIGVQVTTGGVSDLSVTGDDGTTASFDGFIGTESRAFDATTGLSSLNFDGTGDTVDWTIEKTDRTGTEDPAIDIDGDGTPDASYSGILRSGQTATSSVTLSRGSKTATVTTAAGSASWSLDFTERTAVKNPGVDLDGDGFDDATYSGTLLSGESSTSTVSTGVLSTGSSSISFSGSGPQFGYSLSATEVWYTQDPAVDIDGDGVNDASLSGELAPGDTQAVPLSSLSLSTDSASISTSSGSSVGVEFEFRERTETVAPKVEINGDWTNYSTRLSDGETVELTASSTSVVEGTNRVNVSVGDSSLTADAPTPRVGLVYNHSATSALNTDYTGTTWSESYQVAKRWGSDRTDATLVIPFAGNVVQTREVRVGPDPDNLTATSDYALDGTTLTVNLGSVSAGEETVVEVTGSKVLVNDGGISVTQATTEGNLLGTEFEITEKGPNFYIAVNGTAPGSNLHYLGNESWASSDFVSIDSSSQRLYAPDAPVGGTATARTLPLEVIPQTDAEVAVLDPSTPKLELRPGSTSGDEVVFRWMDTVTGETYALTSETRDGYVVDTAKAESPVDLKTSDDEQEVFTIGMYDSGGASGAGGGSGGGGGGVAPVAATQGDGILRSPIVVAPLTVALILGAVLIARRTPVPLSVAGGSSLLVGLLAFESIAPGSVSSIFTQVGQQLASGVGTVSPALLLAGGAVGLWGVYRIIKRLTGRQDVNLTVSEGP